MNTHADSNLKVNQLPRSNLVQDSPDRLDDEAPPVVKGVKGNTTSCQDCGEPLARVLVSAGERYHVACGSAG